jgi:hypothetical protein
MKTLKADWLAWGLQLVFGFIIGAAVGFMLISKRRRWSYGGSGWWVNGDVVPYFIIGTGLLVGAVATVMGDNLWLGYSIFPDVGFHQTNFSRLCSILIGIAGAGMMIYAILTTMKVI